MARIDVRHLKRQAGLKPYQRRLSDLRPSGKEHRAKCPWHGDQHPSLCVYEKNGESLWHCFPCDDGGDVVKFVQKKEDLSFSGALQTIASECHIRFRKSRSDIDREIEVPKSRVEFNRNEPTASLNRAENFLKSRGIQLQLARERGLGYFDHPGIGPSLAIPYPDKAVKFRALNPQDKQHKFRHLPGHSSSALLYGIEQLDKNDFLINPEVFVTESELDALTMHAHGFNAVSVSSATACLRNGALNILGEHMEKLCSAERIFLALDQDAPGQKCADAFERALPRAKTYRLTWPYGGKESTDAKDVGEIYSQSLDRFRERIDQLKQEALTRPPAWRKLFKSHSEMEQGDTKFLINDFLPEGVTLIGGLSASGKTWFSLSIAKALTTGRKFLGLFAVPEPVPVLYMIPESGERAFRMRMEKMDLLNDKFLCRTMRDGVPPKLDDPLLLAAVRDLKPAVFLDTAVRFADGEENSASDNAKGLARGLFNLRHAGAQVVMGLHHSPKASAQTQEMTLENVLRGTGDLGAMCDSVYGLRRVNEDTLEIQVRCVKSRDFEKVRPFHIQGRPFINEIHDFGVLVKPGQAPEQAEIEKLIEAIRANPKASYRELADSTGINKSRVQRVADKGGWKKEGERWMEQEKATRAGLS